VSQVGNIRLAMVRCRPGTVTYSEPDTAPDQRRIISLRYMLRRVRGTRILLVGADIPYSLVKQL